MFASIRHRYGRLLDAQQEVDALPWPLHWFLGTLMALVLLAQDHGDMGLLAHGWEDLIAALVLGLPLILISRALALLFPWPFAALARWLVVRRWL